MKDGLAAPFVYSPAMFSFGDRSGAGHQDQSRLRGLSHPRADQPAGLFRRDRRVSRRELFSRGRQGPDLWPVGARPVAEHRRSEGRGVSRTSEAFWIERPAKGANSIVVHALLDSESAAAAYRFTIRPGETTVYDIEATLFPRVQIDQPGLATLTSMYFFGAERSRRRRRFPPRGARLRRRWRFRTGAASSSGGR